MNTVTPFEKVDHIQVGPRTTRRRGDIVRIAGRRGRFRFLAHVHPRDKRRADWVDVIQVRPNGEPAGGGIRSFPAKAVR